MTSPANTTDPATYGTALAFRHQQNNVSMTQTILKPTHNLYDNSEWIVTFAETGYKIDLIKTIREWARTCGGEYGLAQTKEVAEGTRSLIVTSVYALALLSLKINETNRMIVENNRSGIGGSIGSIISITSMEPARPNTVLRV